jgi:formiminoglutamate deiminase
VSTPGRYWCELALVDGRPTASVLIEVDAGRFRSITAGVEPPADALRLSGFTIPGLSNSHSHAFHRALRSRAQSGRGTFWTWRDLMYRAAQQLEPDAYHRLARATFAEMAMAGISCVGEFHYLHHQRDGTPYANPNEMGEALLAAASEAGLRITLLDTLYLHGGLGADGYTPPDERQRRFVDRGADAWMERVGMLRASDTQRIGAAIHSVRAVDPVAIENVADWATDAAAPIHAHVSEQLVENEACSAHHGRTPLGVFDDAGALSGRFTAVHATHVTDDDITLLASSSAMVAMCPTTERDLGDGIGPTALFADAGVRMSLGSDSHAVIDQFDEARALELDERLRSRQRGIRSAPELFAMATINGHRGLGWDDAGTIRVGNRADLVAVALDSVRTAGSAADTALETVIFAANASDVTEVVVDGHHIVVDGHHAHIDVAAELHDAITGLMGP